MLITRSRDLNFSKLSYLLTGGRDFIAFESIDSRISGRRIDGLQLRDNNAPGFGGIGTHRARGLFSTSNTPPAEYGGLQVDG